MGLLRAIKALKQLAASWPLDSQCLPSPSPYGRRQPYFGSSLLTEGIFVPPGQNRSMPGAVGWAALPPDSPEALGGSGPSPRTGFGTTSQYNHQCYQCQEAAGGEAGPPVLFPDGSEWFCQGPALPRPPQRGGHRGGPGCPWIWSLAYCFFRNIQKRGKYVVNALSVSTCNARVSIAGATTGRHVGHG